LAISMPHPKDRDPSLLCAASQSRTTARPWDLLRASHRDELTLQTAPLAENRAALRPPALTYSRLPQNRWMRLHDSSSSAVEVA